MQNVRINKSGIIVLAVVSMLLGCLPVGLIALVFALGIEARLRAGDAQGAAISARRAVFWALLAFPLQLLMWVVYGLGHQGFFNYRKK